ncbi:MAG TPA: KEOPS complex N(6)-L-threonylcarbamoyladenine synthase Kae1 [Candidatus Nanoarchaeia archaeon]|nr:KEOPS complex N(6)-L-threonylcarbamoyladenine synthase Kae1 [Candidatus Nanoarchaeia archaeon]
MIALAIESTAHTFSVAVVNDKGKILSNIKDMYQTESGGIIPIQAAKHHLELGNEIIQKAIQQANIKESQIDIVAFSQGPGLPPCLVAGKKFAHELSLKLKKPLIPVNHLISHLEIGLLTSKMKDPVFILATGANTQIIAYEGKKYRIFGECLSIGIGNALDKFGRAINLGFPAGPKIEQLALSGKYIELPYSVKGMDVEFSGIITQAINLYKKGAKKEDLCFSLQETCFSMLTEVAERALAHTDKKELLLIGGVAANKRLSQMLEIMCKERKCKFSVVPLEFCGDNGAMIAWNGIQQYQVKKIKFSESATKALDINPNYRIDDIEVFWKD